MPSTKYHVVPHDTQRHPTVRAAYIQNLVDLLHACILRRELDRARRAWAILVRHTFPPCLPSALLVVVVIVQVTSD